MLLALVAVSLVAVAFLILTSSTLLRLNKLKRRFRGIFDAEAEAARVLEQAGSELARTRDSARAAVEAARQAEARSVSEVRRQEEALRTLADRYNGSRTLYDRLQAEVALLEENLESISYGLYRPHYTFDTSAQYKAELGRVYERKKEMVRSGAAASTPVSWSVGDNRREGEKMVRQLLKLMLRAFNGEVDAAVAKVAWNNVTKMEERIHKAFDAINSMGGTLQASVSTGYRDLALAELRLTHEHETKKYEEKEEQRQIREQMREEERAQREFERAQREAMAEEDRYAKSLERARAEIGKAQGAALDAVHAKIQELEVRLAEAHAKSQRAIAMAQLTRAGYVYVISNVGSFGENVFKVGMTRRLEPLERVQELGDASVPFYFYVHAMIYSDDAPSLENAFHRQFAERRMNLVNMRKEFFQVELGDLERFAKQHKVDIQFTQIAEAREYRETLARRTKAIAGADELPPNHAPVAYNFPEVLEFA